MEEKRCFTFCGWDKCDCGGINMIEADSREHSSPRQVEGDRSRDEPLSPPQPTVEEIARIIDPELWKARDRAFSGEPFTPWAAKMDASLTGVSLTKARQIASLHSRGGRGDLGVSRDLIHASGVKLEGEC